MEKKIKEIYDKLPKIHQNLAFFAHHLVQSINQYKDQQVKSNGHISSSFFNSINLCHQIIIEELENASEHVDEIEARYEEVPSIKRLQEFKASVPISHKDLAIFVQELLKRYDDLKMKHLAKIGLNFINEKEIDRDTEKIFLEVIDEVEFEIMQEVEKTYEDIKNYGKPGYLKNYIDGIK